jgi:hypothetical protein
VALIVVLLFVPALSQPETTRVDTQARVEEQWVGLDVLSASKSVGQLDEFAGETYLRARL